MPDAPRLRNDEGQTPAAPEPRPQSVPSVTRRTVLASLGATALGACSRPSQRRTSTGGSAVFATDSRGVRITLEAPARRIVCLIESALSGLFMLGAEDSLVGVSSNIYDGPAARYYAAMDKRLRERRLPAPGNWDFVSTEAVAALAPDLVIVWAQQTESIAALEALGLPCYGVFLRSVADIVSEIQGLGALTARERRANEIVARAEAELREVASRVASIPVNQRPRTYFAWSQGLLETSGGVGLVQELLERAGTANVCAAIREEHAVVDVERLLAWNPELVVLWGDERRSPRDVLSDTRFGRLSAVRRSRVYELPDVFLTDLWTLKLAHAVRLVATWAHPGLFAEAEIRAKRNALLGDLYTGKLPLDRLPGEEASG